METSCCDSLTDDSWFRLPLAVVFRQISIGCMYSLSAGHHVQQKSDSLSVATQTPALLRHLWKCPAGLSTSSLEFNILDDFGFINCVTS